MGQAHIHTKDNYSTLNQMWNMIGAKEDWNAYWKQFWRDGHLRHQECLFGEFFSMALQLTRPRSGMSMMEHVWGATFIKRPLVISSTNTLSPDFDGRMLKGFCTLPKWGWWSLATYLQLLQRPYNKQEKAGIFDYYGGNLQTHLEQTQRGQIQKNFL